MNPNSMFAFFWSIFCTIKFFPFPSLLLFLSHFISFFSFFPFPLSPFLFFQLLNLPMDTAHWPQFQGNGVVVKQMEASREGGSSSSSKGNGNNSNNNNNNGNMLERKERPQKDQALNCPRCNSTNTKFCYYNNYSLSQPRYFCKACRRYWTNGGSLRNVPVGGGSRKNKRSSLSSSSASSGDNKKINGSDQNPKIIHHVHQDLNLAIFPPNTSLPSADLGSFMTAAPAVANGGGMFGGAGGGGFGLHEMKPSLSFSLEGFENSSGYGDFHHQNQDQDHEQDQTAVMFPIEDLKQSNGAAEFEQNRGGGGYWNGMLGGGSW